MLSLRQVRKSLPGAREMPSATVTSKGQVTIPKSIRGVLKVEAGDRLDFVVEEGGRVVVRPGAADVTGLKGLLHRPGRRPVTIDEMNAAIVRQGRPRG
jgi:antitoxin PrlF